MPRSLNSVVSLTTPLHSDELAESQWLQTLTFRKSEIALTKAAANGEMERFATALAQAFENECRIGKRERGRILKSLAKLWGSSSAHQNSLNDSDSLTQSLLEISLTSKELSERVETMMSNSAAQVPDHSTLVAAHWILRLAARELEPQTLVALYRWTLGASEKWIADAHHAQPEITNPEAGVAAFDLLELQYLNRLCYSGLKGSRKLIQQFAKDWRFELEASTDSDGTPHSRWLDEIIPRFCQVASVSLFAELFNQSLWNQKSHKLLEGLFARIALLVTPQHISFHSNEDDFARDSLSTAAEVLRLKNATRLIPLLSAQKSGTVQSKKKSRKAAVRVQLPITNQQSDWADWACLRSSWGAPVDACVARYDESTAQLEVIAADLPLLAGAWSHELKVDGKRISHEGEWHCCCWFVDRQAAFIELQLNRKGPIQLIRQALLLRNESVLMLADSVRIPKPGQIDFRRSTPLAPDWSCEEDTLSREFALVQGSSRVRVFPWTGEQMRVHGSQETTSIDQSVLTVNQRSQGQGIYVATLFDWSGKRREDPVEWQRVTVAEDGQIIPPEKAVGHRLRLGKKQWLLYHSLQQPTIPRSVLGVHTLSETVFSLIKSNGDAEVLVEVEL